MAGAMAARQRERQLKQNAFQNYAPTAHDVFVMTYAKSGTNWMMQIAHQLLFHGKGEFDHIHCVVPWPDSRLFGPMSKYAIPEDDPSVWIASPEQKRVIKTHYNWELLPYSEEARYIAVIRDPKDVFVSNYHFFGSVIGPAMPPGGHMAEVVSIREFPDGRIVGGQRSRLLGPAASPERARVFV